MKHALILHAWHNVPGDYWYPWLSEQLKQKGYDVSVPELPTMNTDMPDLEQQMTCTEPLLHNDSVVFGHSLGALLAMRLAEKRVFSKMFLFAGWDFNELTPQHQLFWKTPMNHTEIKKHVSGIYVVSSDNDPYITAITAEDMCNRLGGTFILVKGAGHFTASYGVHTVPDVLPFV